MPKPGEWALIEFSSAIESEWHGCRVGGKGREELVKESRLERSRTTPETLETFGPVRMLDAVDEVIEPIAN